MKIIHFCLSNYYIDNHLYQENELVRAHVRLGYNVLVVASTECFDSNGKLDYVSPREYVGSDNAPVIRLPYRKWLPRYLARLIRSYPKVKSILTSFKPDVVVFHGSSAWDLITVANYIKNNPKTIFHIDSHADAINSGKNFFSLRILHQLFYALILKYAMQYSGPLLCVSKTVMQFAHEIYKVPKNKIRFYPLGGTVLQTEIIEELRSKVRKKMNLKDTDILIVQSGKQSYSKKLLSSLRALSRVDNQNLKLVIAGVLMDDIKNECELLIQSDSRVSFIGWQDPENLTSLLCAADVYLQPGTQSATMQHSLCCGCAIIIDKIPAHEPYICNNGWLISTEDELRDILDKINSVDLKSYQNSSLHLAGNWLDYKKLASQVLVRDI